MKNLYHLTLDRPGKGTVPLARAYSSRSDAHKNANRISAKYGGMCFVGLFNLEGEHLSNHCMGRACWKVEGTARSRRVKAATNKLLVRDGI